MLDVAAFWERDAGRGDGYALAGYRKFCKVFNEQTKQHGMTRKAATETIRICRDRNVLRE